MEEPFELGLPQDRLSPAVFSSPHSGHDYPEAFLASSQLDTRAIRSSEDAFVDRLFAAAPRHGAVLIAARYPRAYLDLNRGADELDPALVEDVPRRVVTPRIAAGLGVIPRVVAEGRVIRCGKIPLSEARARIDQVHTPYHDALMRLLVQSRDLHGRAVLFDCHSMPSEAIPRVGGGRPEIILGDRFGASCGKWLLDGAEQIFREAGFRTSRNTPFAGGFITQHYGRPSQGLHALQIEIDRSLYMDERCLEPLPDFDRFARRIGAAVARLSGIGRMEMPLAAE